MASPHSKSQLPGIPDSQVGTSDLGDRVYPWSTQHENLDDPSENDPPPPANLDPRLDDEPRRSSPGHHENLSVVIGSLPIGLEEMTLDSPPMGSFQYASSLTHAT